MDGYIFPLSFPARAGSAYLGLGSAVLSPLSEISSHHTFCSSFPPSQTSALFPPPRWVPSSAVKRGNQVAYVVIHKHTQTLFCPTEKQSLWLFCPSPGTAQTAGISQKKQVGTEFWQLRYLHMKDYKRLNYVFLKQNLICTGFEHLGYVRWN